MPHYPRMFAAIDKGSTRVNVELGYDIRFGMLGKLLRGLVVRKKLEKAFHETLVALRRPSLWHPRG